MPDVQTINGEDLIFALDLANDLREKMAESKLEALPFSEAHPGDASNCVLAMAFNFDCSVDYESSARISEALNNDPRVDWDDFDRYGVVTFDSEAHAKALAVELKVPVVESSGYGTGPYEVPVPTRVAQIARLFDEPDGRVRLDHMARELGWKPYYA